MSLSLALHFVSSVVFNYGNYGFFYFSVIMDHNLHCSFFITCRLCGKVPFQSDTATKLEESILKGEVKFREVEWITVSDKGTHI